MIDRSILVRWFFLVLLCLVASPSVASAQTQVFDRTEVSFGAGWSRLSDEMGFLGTDTDISGGLAFFVTNRVAIGVEVNHTKHTGVLPLQEKNRRSEGESILVSGNLRYRFGKGSPSVGSLSPYLVAGVGSLRLDRSDRMVRTVERRSFFPGSRNFSEETLSRSDFRRNEVVVNGGGGIEYGLSESFFVRPDFRFFVAASQRMMRASVALAYRW